jgi:hypothetical protein
MDSELDRWPRLPGCTPTFVRLECAPNNQRSSNYDDEDGAEKGGEEVREAMEVVQEVKCAYIMAPLELL